MYSIFRKRNEKPVLGDKYFKFFRIVVHVSIFLTLFLTLKENMIIILAFDFTDGKY